MASGKFMMVAVPHEGTREATWMKLAECASPYCDSSSRFDIPDLRVGTLDSLVSLSESLQKDDTFGEQLTRKLGSQLGQLLNNESTKLFESLNADGKVLQAYLGTFRWDSAKYNTALSADALRLDMNKKLSEIDAELKTKMIAFGKLKTRLQQFERKSKGNLLVRDVSNVAKPEFFVQDSEFLVTILVVIPSNKHGEWLGSYERLNEYVVPRSSVLIPTEDKDMALYTVTLARRVVDEFKGQCRENGFTVKEFEFDEEGSAAEAKEMSELKGELKKKYNVLVKWCSTMFSEAFIGWTHLKALRLFVEAVLRYGLPVNFQAAFLEPKAKGGGEKKLKAVLSSTYAHLDTAGFKDEVFVDKKRATEGPNPASMGIQEYDAFVNYTMDLSEYIMGADVPKGGRGSR